MLNLRPKGDEEKENNSLIRPSFFSLSHHLTLSSFLLNFLLFRLRRSPELTFIHSESKCNIYTSFRMNLLRLLLLFFCSRSQDHFLVSFIASANRWFKLRSLSLSLFVALMLPIQHIAYNFYHSPLLFPFCILALASAHFRYVHNRSVLREKY